MKPVLTRAEMADVDAAAARVESFEAIVERAGTAVERTALAMLGGAYGRRVVVVAGHGHNGDDGRVAARRLRRRGAHVLELRPDGGSLPACDLVIDAAFGTGFRGHYSAQPAPPLPIGTRAGQALVLAVDVPSGVDADTGEACPGAVRADCTVTFGAHKPGLVLGDGPEHAGRVVLDLLDLPVEETRTRTWMVEDDDVARSYVSRRRSGHKWDTALYVVAGSPGMLGAAALVATGAQRAGAGMVRLGSPGVVPGSVPVTEAVARRLPEKDWAVPVLDDLGRARALVLGPGLGATTETTQAVRRLVAEVAVPVVLDADGLNALGTLDEAARVLASRRAPIVLTPHDGEYARLVGSQPGPDRLGAARDLARRARAVVLLKGAATIVATPEGGATIVVAGSRRLSTAGTGDVLAGIVGAFLASGMAAPDAAALAAHVHGRAAARGLVLGLVAGDLPRLVAEVLSDLGPADAGSP